VIFRGLAVPGVEGEPADDLVAIWRSKKGERFQNYRAKFTISRHRNGFKGMDRMLVRQHRSFHAVASTIRFCMALRQLRGSAFAPGTTRSKRKTWNFDTVLAQCFASLVASAIIRSPQLYATPTAARSWIHSRRRDVALPALISGLSSTDPSEIEASVGWRAKTGPGAMIASWARLSNLRTPDVEESMMTPIGTRASDRCRGRAFRWR
jgi:hypothetical protein